MEKVVVPPSSEVELKQTCASGGTWRLVESEASSRLGMMVARGLV